MKVLITGAAGQVGSHLVDALIGSKQAQVLGIDNFATGRAIHVGESSRYQFVRGTIADSALVDDIFNRFRPDVVVHAAASYKDPSNWVEDLQTNAVGGLNLINASQKHKVSRFIYFQTALIYGVKPLANPIGLEHPRRVENSSYAITKGVTEDFLALSGLDYVTFRLANVVGDRCVSGPLPIFYNRLVNSRPCFVTPARRDFVYVGDLVAIVLKAIRGLGSGPYHFSSGKDFAIRDLFDCVVAELGLDGEVEVEERPLSMDDAPSILLDPQRTFEDFGVMRFTPLSETVGKAVDYYKQHGVEGEFTHLRGES